MHLSIPADIRAEILCNYLEDTKKELIFRGSHKRNAYEDILSILQEENEVKLELSRKGLYDILPEALFHPIDRFDNIPANEYKEKFAEEVEQQRLEESNARTFFSPYDRFIFDLSSIVTKIKQLDYSGNNVLTSIICDSLSDRYLSNRFVARALEFTPRCNSIRGNIPLMTLMLRKIMAEEGLKIVANNVPTIIEDIRPRYNCRIHQNNELSDVYLGNCFYEDTLLYDVQYWNEDFCDESFMTFVDDIKVFEDFINDFFMGIGCSIHFNISADTSELRLSDELNYNYLNFNTNLE